MENSIIFHPSNQQEFEALKAFAKALKIKFEVAKEKTYNKEFVAEILESKKQVKEGKVTRVKKEDLNEFLGL